MPRPPSATVFRTRALVFAAGALTLVVLHSYLGRGPRGEGSEAATGRGPGRPGLESGHGPSSMAAASSADMAPAARKAIDAPPGRIDAPSADPAPPEDADRERHHAAWELVEQLEELSRAPQSFHRRALPIVERLGSLCGPDPLAVEMEEAPALIAELLERVVHEGQRNDLVRGAVLLGLARQLSEAQFWDAFQAWCDPGDQGSLERLRAVALAAARRGQPAACTQKLSLSLFLDLPSPTESSRPGVYPLALDRVAPLAACAALERWLESDHVEALRLAGSGASAAERFTTVEVLYCVWAHQALHDSAVEHSLLRTAVSDPREAGLNDAVKQRAAQFVLQSLATCNRRLLGAAASSLESPVASVRSLARSLQGRAVGGLNLETMARIDALRYSESQSESSELILMLLELRDAFAADPPVVSDELEHAIGYLQGLVEDGGVATPVRGTAALAIAECSWTASKGALLSMLRNGDALLASIALDAMRRAAGESPGRRADVLGVLEGLYLNASHAEVRAMVESAQRELRGP